MLTKSHNYWVKMKQTNINSFINKFRSTTSKQHGKATKRQKIFDIAISDGSKPCDRKKAKRCDNLC